MAPQSLTSGIKEATDSSRQKELLSSARLALRIFFSMNNPGLTEVCLLPFSHIMTHGMYSIACCASLIP